MRFLTVVEQPRLVNVCPPDFRLLVQGALLTGGRYGELAGAQVQDFDPTGGTIFLVGKGTGEGKPRRVVSTAEGQVLFQAVTAGRPAGELIFQRGVLRRRKHLDWGQAWGHNEQSRFMDAACATAGLDPVTSHELRHSAERPGGFGPSPDAGTGNPRRPQGGTPEECRNQGLIRHPRATTC